MPRASKKSEQAVKRYVLVDGNALVHRAYHAIRYLATASGEQTNAVYGFTAILLKALKAIAPTHVAVCFDLRAPTFRHKEYAEYKATRVKADDELYQQMPRIKEVVASLGIPIFEKEGFEADDVLGTLAARITKENGGEKAHGYEILIVTGDLDTLQLVNSHVKIYTFKKGINDTFVYDEGAVRERYGIEPSQFVDFKAIKGDPSDNIPGVNGIGEKGAIDLIKEYGSLAGIYKNLGKLKEKTRKMFEDQREQVEMSRHLSEIVCNVPIDFDLPTYSFSQIDYQQTVGLFQKLEFRSLISKLPKAGKGEEARDVKTMTAPGEQPVLSASEQPQSQIVKSELKYETIDTSKKLAELCSKLSKQKKFAVDTETAGLGSLEFALVGIGVCFEEGHAFYVPVQVLDGDSAGKAALAKIFADEKIGKIGHNIKYDFLVLKLAGLPLKNLYVDTMLLAYLLNPGSRALSLDALSFNEFGYQKQPTEDLIGTGKKQISMADVPVEKVSFYCCEDVDFTLRLCNRLLPKLEDQKLEKLLFNIEMPLIPVLSDMEENGILLDVPLFGKLEKEVGEELHGIEEKIYEQAGEEFNINSPTQLKGILFDKLDIPSSGEGHFIKKNKSGFSTAASELEKMRGMHPIVDLVLEYRELSKLQSTYITTLPQLVSARDGRIHTNYNQTIAATGRLSSTNPNLQNIPVRSSGVASEIRRGFVAAPGYRLLSIDYSQIELRVIAHLSGDVNMMKIFKDGLDIHTATAMQIYGVKDAADVTKEQRRDAKTINFGILYGLSSFGLSERIAMSRAEAGDFIKKYFKLYPQVELFLKQIVDDTKRLGYSENELGRRRYFPEINSSAFMVRAAAERAAMNMPIQSLEADIVKIAMNNIAAAMDIQSDECRMLLQVHDALVFEVREAELEAYAEKLKKLMEEAYILKVPLTVEVSSGPNWGDLKA